MERYNGRSASQLRHYVAKHRQHWDYYATPVTHAYNAQVHRSAKLTTFSLVLSRHPSDPASLTTTTMLPDAESINSTLAMQMFLINLDSLLRQLNDKNVNVALKRYMSDHNKKVRFGPAYMLGDHVFLAGLPSPSSATERIAAERYSKVMPRSLVPYRMRSEERNYLNSKKVSKPSSVSAVSLARHWRLESRINLCQELSNPKK